MDCPQCGAQMLRGSLIAYGTALWRDAPAKRGFRSLLKARSIPVGRPGGFQATTQDGYRCPVCRTLFIPLDGIKEEDASCG